MNHTRTINKNRIFCFIFLISIFPVVFIGTYVSGETSDSSNIYRADAISSVADADGYGSIIEIQNQNAKTSRGGLLGLRNRKSTETPDGTPASPDLSAKDNTHATVTPGQPGVFISEMEENEPPELDSVLNFSVARNAPHENTPVKEEYTRRMPEFMPETTEPFASPNSLNPIPDSITTIQTFPQNEASPTQVAENTKTAENTPTENHKSIPAMEPESDLELEETPLLIIPKVIPFREEPTPTLPKTEISPTPQKKTNTATKRIQNPSSMTNQQKTARSRPLVTTDPYAARPYYTPYVPTTGPGVLVLPR